MSTKRLEGKVAIITGAASGIGEAAARLFAEHGAFVVIADIQDELGCEVVASIGDNKASYKHCDVKMEKDIEETVSFAIDKYGTLDIMFSNAGILGSMNSFLEMETDDLDNDMAINLRGHVLAIKNAARSMVALKTRGSIIVTASVAAMLAGASPMAYTVSKHGLVGLVKAAAIELGQYGIRVNCVSPSIVLTPLSLNSCGFEKERVDSISSVNANLKGELLSTKDIAEAALFLASNESGYISAHNLVVDGGISARMGIKMQ